MPRLENSVFVDAPVGRVFSITNDISRWPTYFDEYKHATVLRITCSGSFTELVFELNNGVTTWRSWRLLNNSSHVVIAERLDPLFPFVFMHLRWNYVEEAGGTRMTWIQDFELDKAFDMPLEKALENMQNHTRRNQINIKKFIEQLPG